MEPEGNTIESVVEPPTETLTSRVEKLRPALEGLVAIGSAAAITMTGLGSLALRQRAELIGAHEGVLQYSGVDSAITGIVLVWESLIRAPAAMLASGTPFVVACIALAYTMLMILVREFRPRVRVTAIVIGTIMLVIFALAILGCLTFQPPVETISPWDKLTFSAYAWLMEPEGKPKRAAVLGVVALLTIWSAVAARESLALAVGIWKVTTVVLLTRVAAFATLLLYISILPSAYAYWRWGKDYPRVFKIDRACETELSKAIDEKLAQAWLVSTSNMPEVVVVQTKTTNSLIFVPLTHPQKGRCSWTARTEPIGSVEIH